MIPGIVASSHVEVASGPTFRAASSTTTITNTSGNGFTLTAPTGTTVGDVLIVQMFVEIDSKSGVVGTTPAGWTQRGTGDDTQYGFLPWRTFSRVATGTDSLVWSGGANWTGGTLQAAMIAISGATAVDVAGSVATNATAPSVTTTTAPTLLVGSYFAFVNSTAPPASMTSRVTVTRIGASIVMATESLAASGATGTRVSPTASVQLRYSQLIAVK